METHRAVNWTPLLCFSVSLDHFVSGAAVWSCANSAGSVSSNLMSCFCTIILSCLSFRISYHLSLNLEFGTVSPRQCPRAPWHLVNIAWWQKRRNDTALWERDQELFPSWQGSYSRAEKRQWWVATSGRHYSPPWGNLCFWHLIFRN